MSNIPTGFKPALSKYPSPFDKEALVDDDKELWLIRIPDNLEEQDVVNMKIKLPPSKASKKALGKLEKQGDKYALYKVPTEEKYAMDEEGEEEENGDLGISGHEMISFDCLVPCRENNGKLAFAPKKFDQYLILNQVVDIPDSSALAQSILDKPVYKRDQPKGLKMRFMPYGYYSGQVTKDDVSMDDVSTEKKRKRVNEEGGNDDKKTKKEKKDKKDKKKDKKK